MRAALAAALPGHVRHLAPHRCTLNGKVAGVLTGVEAARHERVVVADDDVRWNPGTLLRAVARLDEADLVRPANAYDPLPWQARWDTGRSLLNRALGTDHPGTLLVRRSTFLAMGGYDGGVLFENLELVRTVAAFGGTVLDAPDLVVRRLPASVAHFRGQRVREAYDDFAQPLRLLAELALVPAVVAAAVTGRWRALATAAVLAVAVAEAGRRHAGALYRGRRVAVAAHPVRTLRRRLTA